jgi:hypothetical protein
VTPLLPILIGVALLGAGIAILRSFGPRYRVGRLLAATPVVPIAEALSLADGPARYVGVRGRIDADEEFEDDAHRPLVLRRARIQVADGRAWRTVDEHRQLVPFEVREDLAAIGVDGESLGDGLVVMPREATGTAAELGERVPAGIAPTTPARLRVDQVSSVEHAIVLGVPARTSPDGAVRMTAGLGRPLILTTLEPAEAMRVLTEGHARRPLAAALALVGGAVALTVGLAWAALGAITGTAAAASPLPSAAVGGDPRSSGVGPGLVGEPLVAIGLVVAIGLAAVLGTLAYVRLTGGPRR